MLMADNNLAIHVQDSSEFQEAAHEVEPVVTLTLTFAMYALIFAKNTTTFQALGLTVYETVKTALKWWLIIRGEPVHDLNVG